MKKAIKNYEAAKAAVSRIEQEIENTRTLPYYRIFRREAERLLKIDHLQAVLLNAIANYQIALEDLKSATEIELEKLQEQADFLTMKTAV